MLPYCYFKTVFLETEKEKQPNVKLSVFQPINLYFFLPAAKNYWRKSKKRVRIKIDGDRADFVLIAQLDIWSVWKKLLVPDGSSG